MKHLREPLPSVQRGETDQAFFLARTIFAI